MDKAQLAAEARRILDNPAFGWLMRGMEQDAIDELLQAKPGDDAQRLAAAERIRLIRDFPDALKRASRPPSERKEAPPVV
jgi:hypothetical protein